MKNLLYSNLSISILCLLYLFTASLNAQCTADHIQLKNWYQNNKGAEWNVNWGQSIDDATMQNWEGVTLNGTGCVEKIVLLGKNLKGILPNLVLPSLKEISLIGGELSGDLPNFQSCVGLNKINIIQQKFAGQIPNFNLQKLTELSLEGNAFTATIPDFNLPNLTTLYLSGNKLKGAVPNFNLPSLLYFGAANNLLDGALPDFSKCLELQNILLRGNMLSLLPNNLTINKLTTLDLAGNQLTGTIPTITAAKLDRLDLSKNKFNGVIPNFDANPSLSALKLNDNQLTGAIPNFKLSALRDLDLSNNQLSDAIPNFNLPELGSLYLSNNRLNGVLPSFNLPNLTYCVLFKNQISGALPILNLPKLLIFNLNDNQISGDLPKMILPNLGSFMAERNQIIGGLNNLDLPKAYELLLTENLITGSLPALKIPNLAALYLNNNKISSIASDINLPKLTKIYLASNNLSGLFPQVNFPLLTAFDASKNKIDSCVKTYPTYPKLKRVNVLGNKLTFEDLLRPDMFFYEAYAEQDSCAKVVTMKFTVGDKVKIPCGVDNEITTNTFKWSKVGDATFSQTARDLTIQSFQKKYAGDYYCEIKNAAAPALTLARRLVRITYQSLFIATVNNNDCSADDKGSIVLTPQAGTAPYTYTWGNNNSVFSADTTVIFTNLSDGNYSVTVADSKGKIEVGSFTISSKKKSPDQPFISWDNIKEAMGVKAIYDTYQWYFIAQGTNTPVLIPNGQSPTYIPTLKGRYYVNVSLNGCQVKSSQFIYMLWPVKDKDNQLLVYPNPSREVINIQSVDNQIIGKVVLRNLLGQTIISKTLESVADLHSIDVSAVMEGFYMLEIYDKQDKHLQSTKIAIE